MLKISDEFGISDRVDIAQILVECITLRSPQLEDDSPYPPHSKHAKKLCARVLHAGASFTIKTISSL